MVKSERDTWTTRVSNPVCYPRFRTSVSVLVQKAALALTLTLEEAPANSVPAAAVIRRVQALIGITGRKEFVGGLLS